MDILPKRTKSFMLQMLCGGGKGQFCVEELRFRIGSPIQLITSAGEVMISRFGPFTERDAEEMLKSACESSVYAKENELIRGFVTLRGGARVGICGEPVMERGAIIRFTKVSSLNVRIPHEVLGCAEGCIQLLNKNGRASCCVIAAPPGVGKTTFLRDLARCFSDGVGILRPHKVAIADERFELTGGIGGASSLNTGKRSDVLAGVPKALSIPMLIRNMSPDIIITDELSGLDEMETVLEAGKCGVAVIASIHAGSAEELVKRRDMKMLFENGNFEARFLKRCCGRFVLSSPILPQCADKGKA